MVTTCSGEKSSAVLNGMKNDPRMTMRQEKLSALTIVCIESDKLHSLLFNDIIDKFTFQNQEKKF
jgi:hypothetical protein